MVLGLSNLVVDPLGLIKEYSLPIAEVLHEVDLRLLALTENPSF